MSTEGLGYKKCLKTKSTYYKMQWLKTQERTLKNTIGEKIKKAPSERRTVLQYGLDTLWSGNIPIRSQSINVCSSGCPVCGDEIFRNTVIISSKPMLLLGREIVCPNCHHVFPSSDFESYYKSGYR